MSRAGAWLNHTGVQLTTDTMIDTLLFAAKSEITAKGEGAAVDISAAENRVFLVTLKIEQVVEQESFDLAIQGSADGATWDAKPLLVFPQRFYPGQTPKLLDVTGAPEVKFVRARWDVNRWGRGSDKAYFVASASLKEVPADLLRDAENEARTRR